LRKPTRRSFLSPAGKAAVATSVATGFPAVVRSSVFGATSPGNRSRREPIAPVEVAHRSCSTCLLHHIAIKTGHQLHWDPIKERFKKRRRGERDAVATDARARRSLADRSTNLAR